MKALFEPYSMAENFDGRVMATAIPYYVTMFIMSDGGRMVAYLTQYKAGDGLTAQAILIVSSNKDYRRGVGKGRGYKCELRAVLDAFCKAGITWEGGGSPVTIYDAEQYLADALTAMYPKEGQCRAKHLQLL